jgi:LmbE family N-acetylglucosaminyl deacetylase
LILTYFPGDIILQNVCSSHHIFGKGYKWGILIMSNSLTLVAIFAHPDDEAFGSGGTLTRYANEGVDVHLVLATRGEAGRSVNAAVVPTQPMSLLREQELRCACNCFGIKQLHLLNYMDGQTTLVPVSEAVFKLVKLLRKLKPQVVISFGPEGIYGHFDHLAVHRWSDAAVTLTAAADRWPEAGPAHRVAKFYHRAMPQDQVMLLKERIGRDAVLMDGIPFPFVGYSQDAITTMVNVRDYAWAKLAGVRCYASQINQDTPFFDDGFDPLAHPWFWQETFILAKLNGETYVASDTIAEDDLFTGVRQ